MIGSIGLQVEINYGDYTSQIWFGTDKQKKIGKVPALDASGKNLNGKETSKHIRDIQPLKQTPAPLLTSVKLQ